MRLLVLGHGGQVARALQALGPGAGMTVVASGRPTLDLARPDTIVGAIADHRPDVVVNAAAYTAVDAAEDHAQEAFTINADGAGAAAEIASRQNIPFIHLSTDYVFDGTKPSAYREGDPTNPLGVYGASKLKGELAVAAANPRHIILRTSWVYDAFGKNFLRTMLRLARQQPTLRVVDDQIGAPTFAEDAAVAILSVAHAAARNAPAQAWGLFHMASAGETSWCGFAREIFAQSRKLGGSLAEVQPIATADYPTKAKRPANSRLDCAKLAAVYGIRLPDWRDGVARCVRELAAIHWGEA
jgi:dTDP-4-dehydrorhamnose reductase